MTDTIHDDPPPDLAAFAEVPSGMAPRLPATPTLTESTAIPQYELGEQAVLGACLTDHTALLDSVQRLTEHDFHRPAHQHIYRAVTSLAANGTPATVVTVVHELAQQQKLALAGGPAYIAQLQAAAPVSTAVRPLVSILREFTAQRGTREALRRADADLSASMAAHAVADRLRERLDRLPHPFEDRVQPLDALLGATLEDLGVRADAAGETDSAANCISTGYRDLDEKIGGLRPGKVYVVVGRPGMGKSVVTMDMVRAATLRQGRSALFCALEMSAGDLTLRILAAEAKVSHRKLADHPEQITDDEWARLARLLPAVAGSRLFIDDTAVASLSDIRARALAVQRTHGLDVVVIDHVGLVKYSGRARTRNEEMGEISRGIHELAKDLDVAVIVPAQLNRDTKNRSDKHPVMTDIRDSGNIEQDADAIFGLYREEVDDPNSPRVGEMDVDILKNRGGETGRIVLIWQGEFTRAVAVYRP